MASQKQPETQIDRVEFQVQKFVYDAFYLLSVDQDREQGPHIPLPFLE